MNVLKSLTKEYKSSTLVQITENELFEQILNSQIIDKYYQIPCCFDIESSSYKNKNGNKRATMYIWQIGFLVNSTQYYVYGRTWKEWELFISRLKQRLYLTTYKFIIYVHNLAYEFQWIYSHIYLTKIFSRKKRHPIYCESDNLIFKCSYFLSNYSLRSLAKERGYTQKENMDYSLIRLSCTPLIQGELDYALIDTKIICEYIQDEIRKNDTIQDIPLTSTGYARRYCFNYISEHENMFSYQKWLKGILPTNPKLFELLYTGYSGAFTHANYKNVHRTLCDVNCVDYSSDYPGIMCRKKFPMLFIEANPEKLSYYGGKAKIMKVTFYNIKAKTSHSVISRHKCSIPGQNDTNCLIDNGRIREAPELTTVLTDLDFDIIQKFYKFDKMKIHELWISDYKYLPKNLILAVLDLYSNKTKLKGVIGKEDVYQRSKELINSVYGMSVTNPLNDEVLFEWGEWYTEKQDISVGLQKYEKNRKIFTAYQWGVWVTAWARWELLNTVYKIGDDVVYCDTDSIKYLNNHDDIIAEDNKRIISENDAVIKYYELDKTLFYPKTIKGKEKPLGVWDVEESYKYFKTLGAKRYCFSYQDDFFNANKEDLKTDDNFFITVAGLPKDTGKAAILKIARKKDMSPFDVFSYDIPTEENYTLKISSDETGKNTLSYHNETFSECVTDYLGNTMKVYETSFAYMEKVPFVFNCTEEYLQLLGLIEHSLNVGGTYDGLKIINEVLR